MTRRGIPFLVLLSLLVLAACTPAPPVISDLSIAPNPNPTVPLAARIQLVTDLPSRITVEIEDGADVRSLTPGENANGVFDRFI